MNLYGKNPQVRNLGSVTTNQTLDGRSCTIFAMTLGGSIRITVENLPVGEAISIFFVQDAVGGRTITWDTMTPFAGQAAVAQPNAAANSISLMTLMNVGSNNFVVLSNEVGGISGGSISVVGGYLTIANDASAPNGIKVTTGAEFVCEVLGSRLFEFDNGQSKIWSSNGSHFLSLTNTEIDLNSQTVNTRIRAGGAPGITVQAGTKAIAHGRQTQATLARRSFADESFWYDCESELSSNAGAGAVTAFSWQCEADKDYIVVARAMVRDITNSQTGMFAERQAVFACNGAAAPTQTGTTLIVGPAGTTGDDRLGAALAAGPATITMATSGTLIQVQFNPVIAGPTNCFVTCFVRVFEARRA